MLPLMFLVILIRGMTTRLRFSYAHFATKGVSAQQLFDIFWECVRQLLNNHVVAVTCDGAACNRKFFKMHYDSKDAATVLYKTPNPYSGTIPRCIYFISDVPHLVKTTRNCWSHSFANGKT